MYKINDIVMYGTFGICKITAIEKRDLTGEEREYYILRQKNSEKNVFYVPVDNETALSNIHYVCSRSEVDELISHMNSEDVIWIENDIKRKEAITQNAKGVYMINKKKCVACGKCVEVCPFHLIVLPEGAEAASKCVACGICVKACPMEMLEIVES